MTDANTGVALDLDALAPKAVQINYKGETINVNPLSLEQFSKLLALSNDLKGVANISADDSSEVIAVYQKVKDFIDSAIPEFKDKDLNFVQILSVFNLLAELNTPEDKAINELKKQGIELKAGGDGDPKDQSSTS
jgi:hypothetical protein